MASKKGQYVRAETWFEQALRKTVAAPEGKIQRARIFRLLAEAKLQHRTGTGAKLLLRRSLREWRLLSANGNLTEVGRAEVELERGKALWHLEKRADARDAFAQALEYADDDSMYAEVVAFLAVQRDYVTALDTYHRALASPKIRERLKIYMSLWVVGLAKRDGRAPDSQAFDYLQSASGTLWQHSLAKFASGRLPLAAVRQRARTPGQRAELSYYAAAVGPQQQGSAKTAALLKRVIASNVVLFFEFDMAKGWLANIKEKQSADRLGTRVKPKAKDAR